MAIDETKRAFVFGSSHQGDDHAPRLIESPYGAYRAYGGPNYDVLCCGINYPYFVRDLSPKPMQQLDKVNVTSMGCGADFIVCACSGGKLLIIPLRDMDNFRAFFWCRSPNIHQVFVTSSVNAKVLLTK